VLVNWFSLGDGGESTSLPLHRQSGTLVSRRTPWVKREGGSEGEADVMRFSRPMPRPRGGQLLIAQ
jgi:hypothetical protein